MSEELPTLDQTTAKSPSQQHSNQFNFIKEAVIRHWFAIGFMALVAAIIGGVVGLMLDTQRYQYEAQSTLLVKPSFWQNPVMDSIGGDVFGKVTAKSLLDRLVMEDVARDVTQAVIQQDVALGGGAGNLTSSEEIEMFANQVLGQIELRPYDDQGIILVVARSFKSKEDARRLAEFTVRVLVDHTQLQRTGEQVALHETVKDELDDLRSSLDMAEKSQWEFREEMGFKTHSQVWAEMESKTSELNETKIGIGVMQQKIEEKDAALAENDANLPDALGNVTDSVIRELMGEIDELRREHVKLSVIWQPTFKNDGMMQLEDEIAEKKTAIITAIEQMKGSSGGGSNLWNQRQDLYRQGVALENDLAGLEIRKATLEKNLSDMVATLPTLNNQSLEYEQMSHTTEQIRSQFNLFLQKEFQIKQAIKRGSATVERRKAATVIDLPTGSGMPLPAGFMIGGLIGLVFGFGYAVMQEASDTSIKTREDVNHYINTEVIGMIPLMKFGSGKKGSTRRRAYVINTDEEEIDACIVTQHDPKSPISEAYRSFRTNFQFSTLQKQPKSVMITSSIPGEGKTTTAVNFAVTMADRGMRVLILDTDLRRPNVHRVLKMERGSGLADVLREQIPLKDVIRPTHTENLWIISSGRVPPNPSELIGSQRMDRVMEELGETFDFVICDAPSVLVVTDPVLLATHVDTVVLVIAVERAHRETVQHAKKLLETVNPHIAGAVLNGLEATARHYYYYYYYYDEQNRVGKRKLFNKFTN
jgi:capsular exopolysaccharide synthesis family protein